MAILNTHTIGNVRIIEINDSNPYIYNLPIGSIAINNLIGVNWIKRNNTTIGWETLSLNVNEISMFIDYISTATTADNVLLTNNVASGGAVTQVPYETFATAPSTKLIPRIGVSNVSVSATATSRSGQNNASGRFILSTTHFKKVHFEYSLRIVGSLPVLATNEYKIRFGYLDSIVAQPTNGFYFESPNNGETAWRIVSRNGGVETSILTSYNIVFGGYMNFIGIWDDTNTITFYIKDSNGVTNLGSINTNIPTTSIAFGHSYIKTVGVVTGNIFIDYTKCKITTKTRDIYD
jgi:hypothetical protein